MLGYFAKGSITQLLSKKLATNARPLASAFVQSQHANFAIGQKIEETTIGVPKESFENEKRIALSPDAASRLMQQGFKVQIESGAGALSDFPDAHYEKVGAAIVSREEALGSDMVMKVRQPTIEEIEMLKEGGTYISHLYPKQNIDLVNSLK